MAKKSSGGMGTFNKIAATIPREALFEITMNADSTTEVWVDIDTELGEGEAWLVYGMEWCIETIDPTVPLVQVYTAGEDELVLQIHRNDDNEVLLQSNDRELLMQQRIGTEITTSGAIIYQAPWRLAKRTVTMQPTLRAIFRSTGDVAGISAATNQLAGKIFYDVFQVGNIGTSKLGMLANL